MSGIGDRLMAMAIVASAPALAMPAPASGPLEAGRPYGYSAQEMQQVLGGAILSKPLPEKSDKELAGVVALVFPRPIGELGNALLEGQWLRDDKSTGPLRMWKDDQPPGAAFAAMQLGANDRVEIARFLRASADGSLNLAESEVARFRRIAAKPGAASGGAVRAVNSTLRSVLEGRYDAYRKDGLRGILPYARQGKEPASPGKSLALAIQNSIPPREEAFGRALLNYPADPVPDMQQRFFCYRQDIDDRPAFILSHRAGIFRERSALIAEVRYYVGHTYEGRFIASDCVAVPGGTLLFYVNRTFTDRVAGIGSGLRHGIGRKRMLDEVAANLKVRRDASRK